MLHFEIKKIKSIFVHKTGTPPGLWEPGASTVSDSVSHKVLKRSEIFPVSGTIPKINQPGFNIASAGMLHNMPEKDPKLQEQISSVTKHKRRRW
jgi:hypothetical protein